jgi:hypothetical protein
MHRFIRTLMISLLAIAGIAGFGLVTSCNIAGSSSGTGNLMMLMTDGPTDDWTEVTVHFLSASLHRKGAIGWEALWTAIPNDPSSGKVNLVDLSGISDILSAGTLQAGTYDRLKLVMNTSTAADSMNLVTSDGTVIQPENITVVDPSGTGEIKVDLAPSLVVEPDQNNILSIDFDLAHPLSIVNLDGKVVISLKVRHKALPRHLNTLQFARTLGDIVSATPNTDGTAAIKIKNLQGTEVDFVANGSTFYTDVTSGTGVSGTFDLFKALAGTGAALVASNMQNDGSLYARRVWYADSIDKLPQFSPEGLVRRVGDSWLSIQKKQTEAMSTGDHHHRCDWNAETVFVNADTTWTFQGTDMGVTGVAGLAYVSRGYRVEVVSVDENVTPKIAQSINIQFAHSEGIVVEVTPDTATPPDPLKGSVTLGWFWRSKTLYGGDGFSWWFYGADSSYSSDFGVLSTAVTQAKDAHLWVFAYANLTWDVANLRWNIKDLVLAPLKLHEFTKITTPYTTDTGSIGVSTYNCWDATTPETMTIKLDPTGDLQTIVGSFIWNSNTNLVSFTLPVPTAQWPTLLTTALNKVKIWVYPVKDGEVYDWHAYCVIAYQFITNTVASR